MDPRYPHATRGILLILLATCCFGCLDTMSKYLVTYYPASALVWLRYVLQTIVMAAIFFPRRVGVRFTALRSCSGVSRRSNPRRADGTIRFSPSPP